MLEVIWWGCEAHAGRAHRMHSLVETRLNNNFKVELVTRKFPCMIFSFSFRQLVRFDRKYASTSSSVSVAMLQMRQRQQLQN